ncbi:MAG: HD domain-containing protein [Eggerthellaceae bacterium]|nr:HD domain-containing protein [Eggerthellaceae bacterium]MBQ9044224.1 HD domain-containing protein [Eggerthellaceae bacterium]
MTHSDEPLWPGQDDSFTLLGMIALYYDIMLAISLVAMIVYLFAYHKHFDVHITLLFVLVPISNLGNVLLAYAPTLEAALVANKVVYIGACYLQLILMLAVFSLCQIKLSRWIRTGLVVLSTVVYLSALTMGESTLFYESVALEHSGGATVLAKTYGPMHTVFIVMVLAYFVLSIGAIVFSYFRKNQVSRTTIYLLFLTEFVALISFFGGRFLVANIELLPAAYNLGLVLYLVIIYRINLYDITDTAIDSLVQTGDTGFVSFDFKFNYLGSNATAKAIFPELNDLTVDRPLDASNPTNARTLKWLKAFEEDEANNEVHLEHDGRIYLITVTHLYNGKRKTGYQLFIADDTERQRYIKLLNSYNAELESEVAQKTAHIVEMHDNLILSMATMVESRDNSTGGHIRRTSEGVRLLIEEMRADETCDFTEKFCHDIVKAAPMHDLGKIAVDDAILRKPGRFTPEEFEKMKAHAPEGARIVHEILKGTDDLEFHHIAENVAHYHHERWDGSGYPKGLAGEEIPIEARIMAIADVYDALVSKRVYKESMSFEQADSIIMDGMGTQFDPALEKYYLRAKPKFEQYYSEID